MRIVTFTREFSEALKSNLVRNFFSSETTGELKRTGDELAKNFKIALDELTDDMFQKIDASQIGKNPYRNADECLLFFLDKEERVIGVTVGAAIVEGDYKTASGKIRRTPLGDPAVIYKYKNRKELAEASTTIYALNIPFARTAKDISGLKNERENIQKFYKKFGQSIIPLLKNKAMDERFKTSDAEKMFSDMVKLVEDFMDLNMSQLYKRHLSNLLKGKSLWENPLNDIYNLSRSISSANSSMEYMIREIEKLKQEAKMPNASLEDFAKSSDPVVVSSFEYLAKYEFKTFERHLKDIKTQLDALNKYL